jgi:glucose-1-phosphatase
MTIRAVLLDLGNVLAFHDNELLARRLAQAAGAHPDALAPLTQEPLARRINAGELGPDALRLEVSRLLGREFPMPSFRELWSCHFTVHDEVLPRVEALAERVRLVLLSNTNALHFEDLLPKLPILERFFGLVLSYEVGAVKPEPAIFSRAVQVAQVAPHEALFFDDLRPYVDAARAFGLNAEVFTTAEVFDAQLARYGL